MKSYVVASATVIAPAPFPPAQIFQQIIYSSKLKFKDSESFILHFYFYGRHQHSTLNPFCHALIKQDKAILLGQLWWEHVAIKNWEWFLFFFLLFYISSLATFNFVFLSTIWFRRTYINVSYSIGYHPIEQKLDKLLQTRKHFRSAHISKIRSKFINISSRLYYDNSCI